MSDVMKFEEKLLSMASKMLEFYSKRLYDDFKNDVPSEWVEMFSEKEKEVLEIMSKEVSFDKDYSGGAKFDYALVHMASCMLRESVKLNKEQYNA